MGFDVSCKSVAKAMKCAADDLIVKMEDYNKEEKLLAMDWWLEDCDMSIKHLHKCDPYPSDWGEHGQPYTSEEIDMFINKMEAGLDTLTQSLMKTLE